MEDVRAVPRLCIAGTGTGTGKTTVAIGLTAALRRRGRTVQTFKVGLDTHDGAYLAHVSGRPCRNLDTWILGADGVRRSLARGNAGADLAVIEGALGLFDSHGPRPNGGYPFPGSTAEVARLAGAPVVVVLDVSGSGETAAAIALGMRRLDPALRLVGAILNGAHSESQRSRVEDAVWEHAGLPVLGALPLIEAMRIPEWGHGLQPVAANPDVDAAVARLAVATERFCNLDLVVRLMESAPRLGVRAGLPVAPVDPPLRLGVAFDEAFCSYYAENLELLADAGAEIVPFSPLEEPALPGGLDALYLGGGCIEHHAATLARNRPLAEALGRARAAGMPMYVEGGGLLYAARRLRLPDGSEHPMTGLVAADLEVDDSPPRPAYRDLRLAGDCLLGAHGQRLRGHEYHARVRLERGDCGPLYTMHDPDGEPLGCDGWRAPGLAASLVQLHLGQDPGIAARLVRGMRSARVPVRA